jgi:hypothetical protein
MNKLVYFMFFSLTIFSISCKKNNKFDTKGQKTGYWIENNEEFTDQGLYLNNKRVGLWKQYIQDTIYAETDYSYKNEQVLKTIRYFNKNGHYLTEQSIDEQIVHIDVKNENSYAQYYSKFKIQVNSDLFLYNCAGCHNIDNKAESEKLSKNVAQMTEILKAPTHTRLDTSSNLLNKFEIEAISNYVNRKYN